MRNLNEMRQHDDMVPVVLRRNKDRAAQILRRHTERAPDHGLAIFWRVSASAAPNAACRPCSARVNPRPGPVQRTAAQSACRRRHQTLQERLQLGQVNA